MSHRLLKSLHSRSRRTKYYRIFSFCLRASKVAIHVLPLLITLQLDEIAVHLFVRIFGHVLSGERHWALFRFTFRLVPELNKIFWLLCIRTKLLGRETNLYVMSATLSGDISLKHTVEEARVTHSSYRQYGASVLQLHATLPLRRKQLLSERIAYLYPILRNAVTIQLDFYLSLFARAV